ncbi:MAG TPA: hypothetical protein VFU22_16675 [Roseiflexaceae bacterium]|nr:hypothetical protein [Roseiflexaceae bacterium]
MLGDRTVLAGFYSYGEISHLQATAGCALHNQSLAEREFTAEEIALVQNVATTVSQGLENAGLTPLCSKS